MARIVSTFTICWCSRLGSANEGDPSAIWSRAAVWVAMQGTRTNGLGMSRLIRLIACKIVTHFGGYCKRQLGLPKWVSLSITSNSFASPEPRRRFVAENWALVGLV